MTAHSAGEAAALAALDDVLAARLEAEELLEEGWAGTVLVEPLTALAGGLLGGTLVAVAAWRLAWRQASRRRVLEADRALRRSLRPRP